MSLVASLRCRSGLRPSDSDVAPEAARRGPNGAVLILAATAIGGGAGYVLQAFAGPTLDTKLYAPFSVFWSALYLFVSALSGLQQEVTRATKPVTVGVSAPASVRHG